MYIQITEKQTQTRWVIEAEGISDLHFILTYADVIKDVFIYMGITKAKPHPNPKKYKHVKYCGFRDFLKYLTQLDYRLVKYTLSIMERQNRD